MYPFRIRRSAFWSPRCGARWRVRRAVIRRLSVDDSFSRLAPRGRRSGSQLRRDWSRDRLRVVRADRGSAGGFVWAAGGSRPGHRAGDGRGARAESRDAGSCRTFGSGRLVIETANQAPHLQHLQNPGFRPAGCMAQTLTIGVRNGRTCAPEPGAGFYFCLRSSRRIPSSASMISSRWTRALPKLSLRLNCLEGGR